VIAERRADAELAWTIGRLEGTVSPAGTVTGETYGDAFAYAVATLELRVSRVVVRRDPAGDRAAKRSSGRYALGWWIGELHGSITVMASVVAPTYAEAMLFALSHQEDLKVGPADIVIGQVPVSWLRSKRH